MKRVRQITPIMLIFISIVAFIWMHPQSVNATGQQQVYHSTSKKTCKQLQDLLKSYNANAIILVNGKSADYPIVINNQIKIGRRMRRYAAPVSPLRLFPISSFQKNVTGLAVYQLEQKHRLSMNAPLAKYYPQVKNANKVSLQALMTHRSGYIDMKFVTTHPLNKEKQLQKFTQHNYIIASKLGIWNYANFNYGMLAMVVAKASHEGYYHYMQKHIFNRYHLRTACFAPQLSNYHDVIPSMSMHYDYDPKAKNHPWTYLNEQMESAYGAGDMFCSPFDYWRFVNNAILNNRTLVHTYQSRAEKTTNPSYYGGFYWNKNQIHCNSACDGYTATIYSDVNSKRTFICFSNNLTYEQMNDLANKIYAIYFHEQNRFNP